MSKAQYDLNEKTRAGLKKYTADSNNRFFEKWILSHRK